MASLLCPEPTPLYGKPEQEKKINELERKIILSLLTNKNDFDKANEFFNDGLTYYLTTYTNVTIQNLFDEGWKHYEFLLLFFMFQYTKNIESNYDSTTGKRTGFTEYDPTEKYIFKFIKDYGLDVCQIKKLYGRIKDNLNNDVILSDTIVANMIREINESNKGGRRRKKKRKTKYRKKNRKTKYRKKSRRKRKYRKKSRRKSRYNRK
tara:strand:+ start:98 stop:718 length:621 start_codon:yes stop_codon:yes gene_type:complete